MTDDLREALRRTGSKPLRAALESAAERDRAARRSDGVTFRSWQGPWKRDRRYRVGDVVEHAGSSWRCLIEHTDSEPPSVAWELVAARGEQGPTGSPGTSIIGPAGPPGPPGPPGPAGGDMTFEDEGVVQGTATTVDIVGPGASVAVAAGTATITVPGGNDIALVVP